MSDGEREARRERREQRRREIARARRRAAAIAAIGLVAVVVIVAVLASGGSKGTSDPRGGIGTRHGADTAAHSSGSASVPTIAEDAKRLAAAVARDPAASRLPTPGKSVAAAILMYHVINPPPSGAPFPGLYVPREEFAEQMKALYEAGFYAVTLEELWRHWHDGLALPKGKPIVLSFDNGYQSQSSNALPILRRYGWTGVENIQLSGLPPSQGGLSQAQIHGLIDAGWELDTQGYSHAELPALDSSELHFQVVVAREKVRRRYRVAANWFCYPSGHYNATVEAAVREAGFRGSTTVIPGWASPSSDPYRLPRLRVLGGTSGGELISLVDGTASEPAPPSSYE